MTNIKQLVSDIERDLLFQIILSLRHQQISSEEAQYLAQDFLALIPPKDGEQLFNNLGQLGQNYPEVQQVYIKYIGPFNEDKRQKALKIIREHIKALERENSKTIKGDK